MLRNGAQSRGPGYGGKVHGNALSVFRLADMVRAMTPHLDILTQVVRGRRTVKQFTGAAIDRQVIDELLELARWAPSHRLHQPWRFVVLDQTAIARLGTFLGETPVVSSVPDPEKGAAKLTKLLQRLPSLGALIQVTWLRDAVPAIDQEDLAAAAAAVQNVLLGIHAAGLAGFWSTNPALSHPETQRWCGIDTDREGHLGCLWIGHPSEETPVPPRRDLAHFRRWL